MKRCKYGKELIGFRSGKLTVIAVIEEKSPNTMVETVCDCGKHKKQRAYLVFHKKVTNCGCVATDKIVKFNYKHGNASTYNQSREYRTWSGAKSRCSNENDPHYRWYGARGVKMCERWASSFENFLKDMGTAPKGLELDRIDVNGDYEPENCRWVSHAVNMNNTRRNVRYDYNGESLTVPEWSQKLNLSKAIINSRLRSRTMAWIVENLVQRSA